MDYFSLLGLLSNLFTALFFISPATIVLNMLKTHDTTKIPYLFFLFTNINCLFCFIYGININSWPIYSNNLLGIIANTMYLSIYIMNLDNFSSKLKALLIMSIILFCIITFSFFMIFVKESNITGSIAMIFNIIMNLSQLQKIKEVFLYRDNSYIPLFTILCLFIQSILWTTIGILSNYNMFIIIPNILGVLLALMQIFIWFYFDNKEGKMKKDIIYDNEKDELKRFNSNN